MYISMSIHSSEGGTENDEEPSVFVVDGGFEVFGRRALFKVNFGSWHDG